MVLLYKCDPKKNWKCKKRMCQKKCRSTSFAEFAQLDGNGQPIVTYLRNDGQAPAIDVYGAMDEAVRQGRLL